MAAASTPFFPSSVPRPTSSSPASFNPLSPSLRIRAKMMPANASMCSRFDGKALGRRTATQKTHHHHHQSIHFLLSRHDSRIPSTVTTSVTLPSIIDSSSNSSSNSDIGTSQRTNHSIRPRDDSEAQELTVYEFNQQDRGSPIILPFNKPAFDMQRLRPVGSLGMLVPFTNKLFDGSLKKRLGITAGACMVIRYNQKKGGCLYEATYSFYFGDLGHISVQGPYADYEDTTLAVTGGTGVFMGVYGTVRLSNVKFPTSLFYRFRLFGIPQLPPELIWDTVPPTENVKPSPNASSPGIALPNFTD